jgi:predicted glycosyltransferase
VPDVEGFPNLSGKLGHVKKFNVNLRYIGVLSRLEKEVVPEIYDLMVIISGPEPQRTLLEEKLISELNEFSKPVLFVKGKVEAEQKIEKIDNIVFYNFMTSDELQKAFNCSNKVLCRSGYTTVMDLAKLEKKAFFIPTPGQFEQEYLAKLYHEVNLVPTASQDDFTISDLKQIDLFRGLPKLKSEVNWTQLFALFKGE